MYCLHKGLGTYPISAASLDIISSEFQGVLWPCGIRVVAASIPPNGSSGATCHHRIDNEIKWEVFDLVDDPS